MPTIRYSESISKILQAERQPLTVDDLQRRLEKEHCGYSTSRSTIYRTLNRLYQAVASSAGHYTWLTHLLADNVIRHPLTVDEARRGYIHLDELEHALFFPEFFQHHVPDQRSIRIELVNGPILEASAYIEENVWALGLGEDFSHWIEQMGGDGHDSLVISVVDAYTGRYQFRLQPRESRPLLTVQRNTELALQAEAILASDRSSSSIMPTWDLVARLIARGIFHNPIPPDDLHTVLHHFSSLRCVNGSAYTAATGGSDFETESPPGVDRAQPDSEVIEAAVDLFEWLRERDFIGSNDVNSMLDLDRDDDVREPFENGPCSELCDDYNIYLNRHETSGQQVIALSHSDYHLLHAELGCLLALQQEFGTLLNEQLLRKSELIARLYLYEPARHDDDFDLLNR